MPEFKTSCKALLYLNKTVHADSEDDLDFLFDLMKPTDDREEMGKIYENSIGYNPLDYFDEKDLRKKFKGILEAAPVSVKSELKDKEDSIISRTIIRKNELLEDHLSILLANEIFTETGWASPSYDDGPSQEALDNLQGEEEEETLDDIEEDDDDKDDETY